MFCLRIRGFQPPQPYSLIPVYAAALVLRLAVAHLDAPLEELRGRHDVFAQDLAAAAEPGEHVEDLVSGCFQDENQGVFWMVVVGDTDHVDLFSEQF